MFCDDCEKAAICEVRESWIYSEQFAQCEAVGHPDYCDDNHFIYAKVTDPGEEETTMKTEEASKGATPPPEKVAKCGTRRGTCTNCEREIAIQSRGMCSVCYGAGRGKAGDAYVFALQKAKERILAGNLLHGLYRKAPSGPKPVKEDKSGKEKVVAASPRKPIKCQDSHLQEAVIQSHPDRMQQLEALLSETVAPQTCIPITLRLIVEISVRVNGIMA